MKRLFKSVLGNACVLGGKALVKLDARTDQILAPGGFGAWLDVVWEGVHVGISLETFPPPPCKALGSCQFDTRSEPALDDCHVCSRATC